MIASQWNVLVLSLCLLFVLSLGPNDANPNLPIPNDHTVVTVRSAIELDQIIRNATFKSKWTILLAPGTYKVSDSSSGYGFRPGAFGALTDSAIRGATGNFNDVIFEGEGMLNRAAEYGFSFGDVDGFLLAYVTIRDVYYHGVGSTTSVKNLHVYNVKIFNTGQQSMKWNRHDGAPKQPGGVVEYSHFGYTLESGGAPEHPDGACTGGDTTPPCCYTGGIHIHWTSGIIVRHNLWENFFCQNGIMSGPVLLVWGASESPILESNLFVNSDRSISLGLGENDKAGGPQCDGGIVRNNVIVRFSDEMPTSGCDVAIYTADPNSKIIHNTIFDDTSAYNYAIEIRWPSVQNIEVKNNLVSNGLQIRERDQATAVVEGNILDADESFFEDVRGYNFNLVESSPAVDQIDNVHPDASKDFNMNDRPYGSRTDVGAFEYGLFVPDNDYDDDDGNDGSQKTAASVFLGIFFPLLFVFLMTGAIVTCAVVFFVLRWKKKDKRSGELGDKDSKKLENEHI